MVNGSGFLGHAQGVGQRQNLHGQAGADPLRAGGDGAGDDHGGRQYSALRAEVVLGQPHGVETHRLGVGNLRERLVESLGLGAVFADVEIGKHAKIHGFLPGAASWRTGEL